MRTFSGGPVVIVGAGLAGAGTALELATRGVSVVLLDQDDVPMNRASLRNEGKIHLGLIYANAPSMDTARTQLCGALHFLPILTRWLGPEADRIPRSTPFTYLVAEDSVLGPDALEAHYGRLEIEYRSMLGARRELDYLGTRPDYIARRLKKIPSAFRPDGLTAAFETPELAIDTEDLAARIRKAIGSCPQVTFLGGHKALGIERRDNGLRVEGTNSDGPFQMDAEHVVNASWEGAAVLDLGMGLEPPPGLLHRLKYRVLARLPRSMDESPSATMVLGRYGDVVIRPGGLCYLSWYPTGLRGWSSDLEPPTSWENACRGDPPADLASEVAEAALRNIERWYPGVGEGRVESVDAGAIVANGQSDVDDKDSQLHDRSRIGVTSRGNYHSLNPGKLTTAPLFAVQAADRVMEAGRG